MKAIAVALVLATALTSASLAADLVIEEPVAAPVLTGSDWDGFYVGVIGGYASGHEGFPVPNAVMGGDAVGALLGLEGGYNWDLGGFVLGIETDLAWAGITTDEFANSFHTVTFGVDWLGTTTVRAGAALDSVLLYAEGGIAYGSASIKGEVFNTPPIPNIPFDNSDVAGGWVVGAGVEVALTESMTAKAEYNYIDLGTFTADIPTGGDHDYNAELHVAKLGLNWQF